MNILGIGEWELIAILLIALVVAGPRRMIEWAYLVGRFMGRLRVMWSETVAVLQREFDDAGVEVKLPTQPPTRQNIARAAGDALKPFTQSIQDASKEIEGDIKELKATNAMLATNGKPLTAGKAAPSSDDRADKKDFGTWSHPGKSDKT